MWHLTHRSMWSDFGPKCKEIYAPSAIVIPCYPHISYIACHYMFFLVLSGLIDSCLSVISSQSFSLVVNVLILLLKIYLLRLFGILCFPNFFMSPALSDRKYFLRNSLLLRLEI